jgi:hypothetical protein
MIDEDICKGCWEFELGYEGHPSWCPVVPQKGDKSCPCILCLVKMLECDSPCDEWYEYDDFVNEVGPRG